MTRVLMGLCFGDPLQDEMYRRAQGPNGQQLAFAPQRPRFFSDYRGPKFGLPFNFVHIQYNRAGFQNRSIVDLRSSGRA